VNTYEYVFVKILVPIACECAFKLGPGKLKEINLVINCLKIQ